MLAFVHDESKTGAAQDGARLNHAPITQDGAGQKHRSRLQHAISADAHSLPYVGMGTQS